MKTHRLSRRLLLTEMGRRTLAVSILGTAVVSCGSADESAPAGGSTDTEPTPAPGSTATPGSATAPGSADADDLTAPDDTASGPLRWERVSFDFVSAYVLVRGREVAIVDTGTSGNAARFDGAFAALGVGWDDVDHVILTHLHNDHVGGLGEVLAATPDAVAYAGEADVSGISSPRPLRAVNDGDHVFGLRIIGTPGHTPGHISVLDAGIGLLVAGDALNEMAGEILGPDPAFTDDMTVANRSVVRLAEESFGTAVFGHGDPVLGMADRLVAELAATL